VNKPNVTWRLKHYASDNAVSLFAQFGNFGNEFAGSNTITVRASLESASGVIYPLWFNGSRSVVIEAGGIVQSEPCGLRVAKGDQFWSRTYVAMGVNDFVSTAMACLSAGEGSGAGDLTVAGTVPTTVEFGYTPFAIRGSTLTKSAVVAAFGDSIMMSQADGVDRNNSWFVKGCGPNYGRHVNHIVLGQSAEWATTATLTNRLMFLDGVTHAVTAWGINDVINGVALATIQTSLTNFWWQLSAAGIKVWQSTITPSSTSSDAWATVGNQTTHANNGVRVALNAWIRTRPRPLTGYLEAADLVESSRDSGLWKAGYTPDGIHPTGPAHTIMSACISTNYFLP
jgi:hypothetical protein